MAKKNELILEIILGDNVPARGLWPFGWGVARHFVTALNLGSMGFWWWQLPQQTSRYYEQIYDLESRRELVVERSPILSVDWGGSRVLSESDLGRVAAAMAALPGPGERVSRPAYGHYLGGLTFLSLNDIHWQCEAQAFLAFTNSMEAMMRETAELTDDATFASAFATFFDRAHGQSDDRDRIVGLVEAMAKRPPKPPSITLSEVGLIKLLCDSYFLAHVIPARRDQMSPRAAGASVQGQSRPLSDEV